LLTGLYIELNHRLDLFSETEYEEIFVPKKKQVQFIFQDGSRVYLNSESRLRFPKKFGLKERKVELEGEGFFEITQNKKRPFIVDTKSIRVKVSGTSFNTKAYPDEDYISVSLENGAIELAGNMLKPLNVKPGEKIIYNRKTGTYEIIRPQDIGFYSAWRQKKLVFKDTPLSEVITTLTRTFDMQFKMEDPAVLNYSFTLFTDNNDINFVLKELEKIVPISFEKNERVIYVKPKS
jgi:ferric-dicitrate binding protein FerR (iron transport regulator)